MQRSSAPVKILRADPMDYTIFAASQPPKLPGFLVEYVAEPDAADLIIASRPENLSRHGALKKHFMVWTAEPRFSLEQSRQSVVPGVRYAVNIMNVYTGLIYQDNYRDNYAHREIVDFDERMRAFISKRDRVAMLATCRWNHRNTEGQMYGGPLLIDGKDIDLTRPRDAFAMHLYRQGCCDIYGRRWPKHIAI